MTLFQIITVCIYGSAIECFYDDHSNETEMVDFQIDEHNVCLINKRFLTTQYMCTCKSDYTKGYVLY